MPQDTATESIVDRVDGISVDSTDISGMAEVLVHIDEEKLPDEIEQIRSWVEQAVEDYLEHELREAGHDVYCQARASDVTDDERLLYRDLKASEFKYSVWVRFE